jgi:hypothetical protein
MIKKKNQMLTNNTYAQLWRQTSTTQHRLLTSFDTDKGIMHMVFLKAQVPDPKAIIDYKREIFEFNTKDYTQMIKWIFTDKREKWFSLHWQMLLVLLLSYMFL